MDNRTQIVFMIFTGLIFVGVLIQTILIAAMFAAAMKMRKTVEGMAAKFHTDIVPAVQSSRAIVEELAPKLRIVTESLAATSIRVHAMAEEAGDALKLVSERTRVYAAQADEMVAGTVERLTKTGNAIQHGIAVPMRQVQGVINGVRAAMDVLCQKSPHRARREAGDFTSDFEAARAAAATAPPAGFPEEPEAASDPAAPAL